MFYLQDPKTKRPSVTLTMAVFGFAVVNVKLLLSGVDIGIFKMQPFSGIEYSAAIAALGGVYTWRKNKTIKSDKEELHGKE